MVAAKRDKIAIWVITPNGVKIARQIAKLLPDVDVHMSAQLR
jgi:hypothetical protein